MLGELRTAAALALVECIEQVATAALLTEALPFAGAVELGHLDVHLRASRATSFELDPAQDLRFHSQDVIAASWCEVSKN